MGTYCLLLHLAGNSHITVGKLGSFDFPAGYYVYCGSALKGMAARIARHRRIGKKNHWHIDYLHSRAELVEVRAWASRQRLECGCSQQLQAMAGAAVPVPGFGSSDCRCRTHLVYFAARPSLAALDGAMGDAVPAGRERCY